MTTEATSLKRGDKVYRVMLHWDSPLADRETYSIQSRTLVVASDKQLRLDNYFDGTSELICKPKDLGRLFYATPTEAVAGFERHAHQRVEGARTALKTAEARCSSVDQWVANWRAQNPEEDASR